MSIKNLYPTVQPSLSLDFAKVKKLDPRITFTRTTTGTFWDGKTTAKAEENLFQKSEEFNDAYWTKPAITVTANAETAPNGTATADKLLVTLAGYRSVFRTETVVANASYTLSVFAKADVSSTLSLEIRGSSTTPDAEFDLTTGTVSSGSGTITAAGGGWYRCSITKTSVDASEIFIIGLGNSALLNDSIFLWGAQLEQRSSVTAYTPTTTQPITNYIPQLLTAAAGQARFDHNPITGESLGLLVEEQRTNLVLRSEEFDNASWEKVATSITANTIVAPDGTLTGDKLTENTANSDHFAQQIFSFTSGTVYTASVYVKAAERTIVRFGAANTTTYAAASFFDVSTGTVVSTSLGSATITSVGNGWYRLTVTGTAGATSATNVRISLVSTGTTTSYTGDGYSGIYIWGAQLEVGAFPTSYIPTVASSVTRNADAATMTGVNFSSWYRADEGSVYCEVVSAPINTIAQRYLTISDGTNSNIIFARRTTSGIPAVAVNASGVTQADISSGSAITGGASFKSAFAYQVNNIAISTNAATVGTDTSAVTPVVTSMNIGSSEGATQLLNGTIKKLAYYPTRLSNAQLQALTT
jgi:hypothetical protein